MANLEWPRKHSCPLGDEADQKEKKAKQSWGELWRGYTKNGNLQLNTHIHTYTQLKNMEPLSYFSHNKVVSKRLSGCQNSRDISFSIPYPLLGCPSIICNCQEWPQSTGDTMLCHMLLSDLYILGDGRSSQRTPSLPRRSQSPQWPFLVSFYLLHGSLFSSFLLLTILSCHQVSQCCRTGNRG